MKWLHEGDENTSYFHRYAAAKKRKYCITTVLNEQNISLVNEQDIEQEFLSFYAKVFTKRTDRRYLSHSMQWSPISDEDKIDLEQPFFEEEILMAINALGSNKSQGPGRYTT